VVFKESNLVHDFILKACHDACVVCVCQERRETSPTKVLVNMTASDYQKLPEAWGCDGDSERRNNGPISTSKPAHC
jgi:hypothetical protein